MYFNSNFKWRATENISRKMKISSNLFFDFTKQFRIEYIFICALMLTQFQTNTT